MGDTVAHVLEVDTDLDARRGEQQSRRPPSRIGESRAARSQSVRGSREEVVVDVVMQTDVRVLRLAGVGTARFWSIGDAPVSDRSSLRAVLREPPAQAEFMERALIEVADGPGEPLERLRESGRCGPGLRLVVHSETGPEVAELGRLERRAIDARGLAVVALLAPLPYVSEPLQLRLPSLLLPWRRAEPLVGRTNCSTVARVRAARRSSRYRLS